MTYQDYYYRMGILSGLVSERIGIEVAE